MLPRAVVPFGNHPVENLAALRELGRSSVPGARAAARRELDRAPGCDCCSDAFQHLARFVGSTLFLDDDPRKLWMAFPVDERARWSPRLIAACIVLRGRERVSLSGNR